MAVKNTQLKKRQRIRDMQLSYEKTSAYPYPISNAKPTPRTWISLAVAHFLHFGRGQVREWSLCGGSGGVSPEKLRVVAACMTRKRREESAVK